MVYLLFSPFRLWYGLPVLICVVAGAHLVKLNGNKWQRKYLPIVHVNHNSNMLSLLLAGYFGPVFPESQTKQVSALSQQHLA